MGGGDASLSMESTMDGPGLNFMSESGAYYFLSILSVPIFMPLDTSASLKGYTMTEDFPGLHINSSVARHTSPSPSTLFYLAREVKDAGLFLPLDDSNYPLVDFNYFALSNQADTNWGDATFTASIDTFEKSFGSFEYSEYLFLIYYST